MLGDPEDSFTFDPRASFDATPRAVLVTAELLHRIVELEAEVAALRAQLAERDPPTQHPVGSERKDASRASPETRVDAAGSLMRRPGAVSPCVPELLLQSFHQQTSSLNQTLMVVTRGMQTNEPMHSSTTTQTDVTAASLSNFVSSSAMSHATGRLSVVSPTKPLAAPLDPVVVITSPSEGSNAFSAHFERVGPCNSGGTHRISSIRSSH
jgi:hypothetical protein